VHELVNSDQDVELIWRAFELRPEPVPSLDPKGDYLQRAWSTSVYPLAKKLGVTMKLPPVQPRTRLAHEAAHWARSQQLVEQVRGPG
jgi:predicted DsbA family dithiol-disulfide isomerase